MHYSIETAQNHLIYHYKTYETVTAVYTQPCNTIYTSISGFNPLNVAFQVEKLAKTVGYIWRYYILGLYEHVRMYMYKYVCIYVYVYMHACIYACMHACMYMFMYTCI